ACPVSSSLSLHDALPISKWETRVLTERGEKMRTKGFEKHYFIMLMPGLIWLILFSVVPMFGIVIAFQDYHPVRGIFGSEWVGLEDRKSTRLNSSHVKISY